MGKAQKKSVALERALVVILLRDRELCSAGHLANDRPFHNPSLCELAIPVTPDTPALRREAEIEWRRCYPGRAYSYFVRG